MLRLDLYVHGTGAVAPKANAEEEITRLSAVEPDYTGYINPMQLRRMSKVVRMGIGAAKICLNNADISKPDAFSVGTGMGCLNDTELFLKKMVDQQEKMLTPTAFIQSTHNTVAGQIALLLSCNGHNLTYVQRGHSFEHAVINTKLYLNQHPGETMLVGGIDELTDTSFNLMQRAGVYTKADGAGSGEKAAAIAGEGASFFAINKKPENALAKINALELIRTKDLNEAYDRLSGFLNSFSITAESLTMVVIGENGDAATQPFYDRIRSQLFEAKKIVSFKNECGEYATASAYGLHFCMTSSAVRDRRGTILFVNHYLDYFSFWLLEI